MLDRLSLTEAQQYLATNDSAVIVGHPFGDDFGRGPWTNLTEKVIGERKRAQVLCFRRDIPLPGGDMLFAGAQLQASLQEDVGVWRETDIQAMRRILNSIRITQKSVSK
jgi:hypothetical protein